MSRTNIIVAVYSMNINEHGQLAAVGKVVKGEEDGTRVKLVLFFLARFSLWNLYSKEVFNFF